VNGRLLISMWQRNAPARVAMSRGRDRATAAALAARGTRRHPRPWQFDYLHLRRLLDDLRPALAALAEPGGAVLDVFCGSRPYDDLYSPGVRVVGLDIDDGYGLADIVTTEFLPCADGSYDGVACIEAFHYVADPAHGVGELRRVVKPGGRVLVAVPVVWEYDRQIVEHRYTSGSLRRLFDDWEDVVVVENGGRVVSWALLTGTLLGACEEELGRRLPRAAVRAAFAPAYLCLNAVGALLDAVERRRRHPRHVLAPNIMLTARRPVDD
jgi:SAM-dependent methyltransferase